MKQEENKPQLQVSLSCQAGGKVHAAAVSTLTSPSCPVSNTLQPQRTGPDQLASFKEKEAELQGGSGVSIHKGNDSSYWTEPESFTWW